MLPVKNQAIANLQGGKDVPFFLITEMKRMKRFKMCTFRIQLRNNWQTSFSKYILWVFVDIVYNIESSKGVEIITEIGVLL